VAVKVLRRAMLDVDESVEAEFEREVRRVLFPNACDRLVLA